MFGIVFFAAGEEVNCKVVVFWPMRRGDAMGWDGMGWEGKG